MGSALKSGIGGPLSHPPVCGILPVGGTQVDDLKREFMDLREMWIVTPSTDLRNLHRDVWRMAHHQKDNAGRTFLFALAGDGRALVRGPYLPGPHSKPASSVMEGERWRFLIDVRTISRFGSQERVLPQTEVPAWLAARLPGFSLEPEALRVSLPRRRAFEEGRTLPYRTITGIVRVTNAAQAEQVLRTGVGRSKAFGFGMLVLTECLEGEAAADPRRHAEPERAARG